ncbi:MAG: hypothetical protein QNJ36_02110 [Calothrix sp. MO_167.B42]|nr:hypothetical protein [Calothrix sp. MO_167.B42]
MLKNNFVLYKKRLFLFFIYFIPVILVLWYVAKFSVNVPFWDEWALVHFFEKFAAGNVNFSDFFAQHNEHRIFFPRIFFLIIGFSSKWDTRLEMYFSIFLTIVSFWIIYTISSNSQTRDKIFHVINIATCFLIFSLAQHENWLWGFQITWFLINTCVIIAIFFLVIPKKIKIHQRIIISAICCFVASFSSAQGLLSWIALIPTIAFVEGSERQKKGRVILWIILFLLSVAIYQIGYAKLSYHPDIFFFVKEPLIAINYLLTILAMPIARQLFPIWIIGLFLLLNWLFVNIYCLKNYQSKFTHDAAPWLSLGWFAVLFALMTTVGRSGFGVEQAMSSRYTSISLLLIVSLLQIWRLLIYHEHFFVVKKRYINSAYIFLVGILTTIFIANSVDMIHMGKADWLRKTTGKSCLEVIHFIDTKSIAAQPNNCLQSLQPDPVNLKKEAEMLQRLGFREFPKDITFTTQPKKNYGYIDIPPTTDNALMLQRSGNIKLFGWAILPNSREQPKIVFLSYGDRQLFFANAVVELGRSDIEKSLNSSLYKNSGWKVELSLKSLPLGETVIKAWVYDPDNKQFVKLNGEPKIKVVE